MTEKKSVVKKNLITETGLTIVEPVENYEVVQKFGKLVARKKK